jgi:dTDP-4-amino-4,6-dideoxygalactose transaminase
MSAPIIVPFVNLGLQYEALREPILAAIDRLSRQGAYILGPEVEAFEARFAAYCEVPHAVAVGNATDAEVLLLRALGIGPGDEVVTAPNSFIATAGGIALSGARPVFCDVGPDYNLDPARLEAVLTPRTKAILPVHLTGMPADMDGILEIAARHGLPVLEDCAQAVGATHRGRKVGSLGRAGFFSLHPLKNLHVQGDGGILTTHDAELAARLRQLRNHGLRNRDESDFWGHNSRLDALQAAIALLKMDHLDAYTARFREIAERYHRGLEGCVERPLLPAERSGVFHNYVIQGPDRAALQAHLLAAGIETKVHYPIPIHLQRAAAELGHRVGDFPVAEAQCAHILSLPIYPELTEAQIDRVIAGIRSFKPGRPA